MGKQNLYILLLVILTLWGCKRREARHLPSNEIENKQREAPSSFNKNNEGGNPEEKSYREKPSENIKNKSQLPGDINNQESKVVIEEKSEVDAHNENKEPTKVKMVEKGGVYEIPVKINDVDMDFIFDTGASGISISETEVMFLAKQNKIYEDDIIGSVESVDATGGISEGTEIILRHVQIGNRRLKNVKAMVVHNPIAPILLGQSALSRFGKVTIDYEKKEIIFD